MTCLKCISNRNFYPHSLIHKEYQPYTLRVPALYIKNASLIHKESQPR